jgi:hypothetical protein
MFDDSKVSKVSRSFSMPKKLLETRNNFFLNLTFLSSFCFFVRILIASFAGDEHTLTLPVDHTKRWLILICMYFISNGKAMKMQNLNMKKKYNINST